MSDHASFMSFAIAEAQRAATTGNYAVGCVISRGDEIIAQAGTLSYATHDHTDHAEMVAIRALSLEPQQSFPRCLQ